jgi:hypothetical protein
MNLREVKDEATRHGCLLVTRELIEGFQEQHNRDKAEIKRLREENRKLREKKRWFR